MKQLKSALLGLLLFTHQALAIPPGYRYVGSLVVSEGRHVYWYWNPDFYQVDSSGAGFVANMYARNLELNEERAFVAIIRCDSRTYRRADSKDPFDRIEKGDPAFEVWRAGCDGGRAATLAMRNERMNGVSGASSIAQAAAPSPPQLPASATPRAAPAAPAATAQAVANAPPLSGGATGATRPPPSNTAPASRGDDRRVDSCVRLTEGKASQFGDASITNTCAFPVEVAYCYKGGHSGAFDCPTPPRRMRVDSLGPGATRNLPEYKRGRNNGIAFVACKGTMGSVIPVLNGDSARSGCS